MVNKIFLDTNILIDYIQERAYDLDAIIEIFQLGEMGKIDLYISESIITTTFYILQKEKVDALSIFREMCKTVNVTPFSKDILYYPLEKYKDTEDGILYFLAARAEMNFFYYKKYKGLCIYSTIIASYNSHEVFKRNPL